MATFKSLAIFFCLICVLNSQVILNPRFAYAGAPVVAAPAPIVAAPAIPATVPGSDGKQPLVNNGIGLLTQSAPLVNAPRVTAIAGVPAAIPVVPAPVPAAIPVAPAPIPAAIPVAPAPVPAAVPFASVPAAIPFGARIPVAAPVAVAAPAVIPGYAPFARAAVVYGSNKSA
ncbi:Hypothetical protein SRAE_1000027100 [Strongyloides ratti]|uniref:Calphotin-like n=1 Tax=Strongyloides ratti TaxID=34506 RepID=A0A090KWV9_STRRB|nr:Hypothetical protein SRAE_1000027100 [Strongyloides ratti]CEF61995.1 Hypothetical protein SRAE_1000027100 [Strongyloides ratti]